MKRRNRWNLVIILCLTVICFFVVKNIRTVSKITFDCIYFTFVKTLFPYENVFVVEKEKIEVYENRNRTCVTRSILIRESLLKGLSELKIKYGLSVSMLVNIAVKNEIMEEQK